VFASNWSERLTSGWVERRAGECLIKGTVCRSCGFLAGDAGCQYDLDFPRGTEARSAAIEVLYAQFNAQLKSSSYKLNDRCRANADV
jgi:hypothetical protein